MGRKISSQGRLRDLVDNLLQNPGFEKGTKGPDSWTKYEPSLPGVNYKWDGANFHAGDHSICIESNNNGFGMWRQVVPVSPGKVYVLSGWMRFENIRSPGHCNLRLVMRDEDEKIVKFVDFPSHEGTRDFAYDFPHELTVRSPQNAVEAEINLFLKGPGKAWFDDLLFGLAPVGGISGTVTSDGEPLGGAHVFIWDGARDPLYSAISDEEGNYIIKDVPLAFPRYILLAEKDGYRTKPKGDIGIKPYETITVNFELKPGKDPADDLRVKFGSMAEVKNTPIPPMPRDAVRDPDFYPKSVKPYLSPDDFIESDNPSVKALTFRFFSH